MRVIPSRTSDRKPAERRFASAPALHPRDRVVSGSASSAHTPGCWLPYSKTNGATIELTAATSPLGKL